MTYTLGTILIALLAFAAGLFVGDVMAGWRHGDQ